MRHYSPLRAIPAAIQKHRHEINIPRPPAKLAEVVASAGREGATFIALLDELITDLRAGYRTGYTAWFGILPEHTNPQTFTAFDWVLWIGAFCIMLFECLCAAVVTSMTLAVSMPVAILVGVALTVVFTLAMKAVWHLHIAPDEAQPRRALVTLYRWLMPLFGFWALTLVIALLLPRLVDESTPAINVCFNIIMSLPTVLSPALSGLLFTAAHLYGWARRYTRRYHQLLSLRRDVEGLLQECERSRPSTPAVEISRHRDSTDLLRQVGQTGTALIVALALAGPLHAQARGEFWIDDSGSANIEDLRSAEDQFFAALPIAVSAGVPSWEFFRFSRNAANARPVARFGITPFVKPACEPTEHSSELTRLFQRPQMAAKRTGEKHCAERLSTAHREFEQELSGKVRQARETFNAALRSMGNCTALVDLMNRIRNQPVGEAPSFAVIVSDAIESCVMLRGVHLAPPKTQVRVLMVVVPSTEGGRKMSPWQEFELRKKKWGETAPWVEVLSVPLLTGNIFAPRR